MSEGYLAVSAEVRQAIDAGRPVVALETAVVTHGLPAPYNTEAVAGMEEAIRQRGGVPATCLIAEGRLLVGAGMEEIAAAAGEPEREKASIRDIGRALATGATAGLTVSATLFAAHSAGIRVFATGGIGGVHRGAADTGDISSDLTQLARSEVVTVCAGAKSVLDIPRTLEYLETEGVPVLGYQVTKFPAFYLRSSGLPVPHVPGAREVARIAQAQWALGYRVGVVVGNAIPVRSAIPADRWNGWIERADREARQESISGQDVTPFLLARVAEYSGGETVRANLALLRHNAEVAADIAAALT